MPLQKQERNFKEADKMKILVTGGAGFIGSNLADSLIAEKHHVFIIDNLSTGKRKNIPREAEFFELDIASPVVEKVFEKGKFDIVFHLAAQMDVRKSVQNPRNDAEINILGGINLLQLSVKHKIKKFMFSSTGGAIYGEQTEFPASENHDANPLSPYGISKLAFEKYLYFYDFQHGLPYISLRYANVYGPRQNSEGEAGVVAIFCKKLLNGDKAVIYGDGCQTRDFVFVEDVVKANLLALRSENSMILNVGTGLETDINTIFEKIKNAANSRQEIIHLDSKPGEQRRSCITHDKIKGILGWTPSVDLDKGIARTVSYFKMQTPE
jgi:UDP-glucose 4-epimerase